MTFAELEVLTQVFPATLRRDLSTLEKAQEIIRVHGGVLDPSFARAEVSFDERVVASEWRRRELNPRPGSWS